MNALDTPPGYVQLDDPGLRRYLAGLPDLAQRLGGSRDAWEIREVGDGNLNLVFLVNGPAGGLCVKQSLPHIRAIKSWRLPVERTFYEYSYFRIVGPVVGDLAPAIYHYEPELFCLVMEQLTPHIVLRRGLVAGRTYPRAARDVAEFIARATFYTSDFGQRFEPKMDGMAIFAKNHGLLRITTDLVFADPYREVERNSRTSPQLDAIATAFGADGALKVAAARLGHKFLSSTQALIHSDLHSGSVMVTEADTRVIDPEFAFYGPIGMDLGAFLGNLLIGFFAQPGLASAMSARVEPQAWILAQIPVFWEHFRSRFLELWTTESCGDAYPPELFADAASRAILLVEQHRFMAELYDDMLGFAAVKMIRRILGFAHVADFLEIADPDRRAACERATLDLAHAMLTRPERFGSTRALCDGARARGEVLAAQLS